jgi:hypothetical protein
MMLNKWTVVLLSSFTASAFAADVYVCEKNGRKEFSQLPCGDNAVILQTEGEPSSLKLTIPFKAKQITALCNLVIKAKDRAVQSRKTVSPPSYSSYNYNSQAYRYRQLQQQQARYDNQKTNSPESYVLGKIENLESIAKNSPSSYQILKNLTNSVYYQGYEESPIYQAERAAALTNCEDNLSERMRYLRD